jgi:hypothetical protein
MGTEVSFFFRYAFIMSDICPEKRDESNLPPLDRSWVPFGPELEAEGHFIPFFRTMQSELFTRAYRKKKTPPCPYTRDLKKANLLQKKKDHLG